MSKVVKRTAAFALLLAFVLSFGVWARAAETVAGSALNKAAAYVVQAAPSPGVGSVGGEWAVFALVRAGADVPDGYYEGYYTAVETRTKACGGRLSERKYTEYARVALALTALGYDPTNVAGYDLLAPLGDYEKTVYQGLSGAIFALLALDAGNYDVPEAPAGAVQATREGYVEKILSYEVEGGGFSLSGKGAADADLTAMALSALARYRKEEAAASAVRRGLEALSRLQQPDGGFESGNVSAAESIAQVIVALCELDIPLDDARFVKNGQTTLDALLSYQRLEGAFAHEKGGAADQMATEQGLYALAALSRVEAGLPTLYEMSDVSKKISFSDLADNADRAAIEALAAHGIVNGMGDGTFRPEETMTRAQFAAVVIRGLDFELIKAEGFSDVPADAWFSPYVGAACRAGIVRGVSADAFSPDGAITVREADIMLARAAKAAGLDAEEPEWIPDREASRAQVAAKLYTLLKAAGKIA